MSTVALTTALLQDAEDLTVEVELGPNVVAFARGRTVEVRRRAGGRRQSVVRAGVDAVYSVSCPAVDRATWHAVEDLLGKTVLFRDIRGHKVFGVISEIQAAEWIGGDLLESLSFTLTRVSFSEAV